MFPQGQKKMMMGKESEAEVDANCLCCAVCLLKTTTLRMGSMPEMFKVVTH